MAEHWSRHLRTANPEQPLLDRMNPADFEGKDEQQWGQQKVLHFITGGTGIFALTASQLVQATRPARVWGATLAFSPLGISDVGTISGANATVQVTFILQFGTGQTMVTQYVTLDQSNLVTYVPDPTFPLRTSVPIASTTIANLPAKQLIVSAQVRYNRILIGAPANLDVQVTAQVAPMYR